MRRRGRSAGSQAVPLTGATAAAFLVAQLAGLHSPLLVAALIAWLVVQATLTSTLVNGVERALSGTGQMDMS
jgi:uncharacterized membrane protein YgaE (UPF0421/DUF939 family)